MDDRMEVDDPVPEALHTAKFDEKWEILKTLMERLYPHYKLSEIQQEMKTRYGFSANDSQYKYHFKKWGWKKSVSLAKKEAIVKATQTRASAGKSTVATVQGREVDKKKLRRHLKSSIRQSTKNIASSMAMDVDRSLGMYSGPSFILGDSIFLNWNRPFEIVFSSQNLGSGGPLSPFGIGASPSGSLQVYTPPGNNEILVSDAASPTTQLRNEKQAIDRAVMFVQGQYTALARSLPKEDRSWLSQFWTFAFTSAKHWGRGPYTWSFPELSFLAQRYQGISSAHALSPHSEGSSPASRDGHVKRRTKERLPMPPLLCYWSVHCPPDLVALEGDLIYDSDHEDPDLQDREGEDSSDQSTWRDWPAEKLESAYDQRLFEGIVTNDFSNIDGSDLPVALPQAFEKHKDASFLSEESLGFAIMAGNLDLVKRITEDLSLNEQMRINPLHLATSYLHGSKSCCLVFEHLLRKGEGADFFRHRNHLGHNIFDNLMLTVLRSHTSLAPSMIDDSLKDEQRFPGEEVDICGRWDAESECYRQLISSGILSVPSAWKHKFCNTSVQSVCHSLGMILARCTYILGDGSGLFARRCGNCGLKMELNALHLTILVALKIADFGFPGEDLMGPLTIILHLLFIGPVYFYFLHPTASCNWLPLETYNSSSHSMDLDTACCHHKNMNAFEFASSISEEQISSWTEEVRRGWRIIWHVLRIYNCATAESGAKDGQNEEDESEELPTLCAEHEIKPVDPSIAALLGALQVELLTYRRLTDSDPWVSPNLDLKVVLKSLEKDEVLSAGPVTEIPLMTPVCDCGVLLEAHWLFPDPEKACTRYFSNLGVDYGRLQVIPPPEEIMQDQ